jgi:hypothetical protein
VLCACLTAASEDGRDGSTGPDLTDRRDDFGKIFFGNFSFGARENSSLGNNIFKGRRVLNTVDRLMFENEFYYIVAGFHVLVEGKQRQKRLLKLIFRGMPGR